MLLQIIPATRLPRTTNFFSYSVSSDPEFNSEQIKTGQIVEINFRNKNIPGLVVGIDKKNIFKYKLKNINKILYPEILISQEQIKLIDLMAKYYGMAKSIIVKSMLPEIPKHHKNTKTQKHPVKSSNYGAGLNTKNKFLFWYRDEKKKIKFLSEKVDNSLANNKQVLILVPEIELINRLSYELNLTDDRIIKIHNKITQTKTKFFKLWLEILLGQPRVIIGTKISVFLPFNNLEQIVVYQEQNWNHKQSDINPRFDARKAAEWLADIHDCNLILTTPAPRIETYYYKFNSSHKELKSLPAVVPLGTKAGKIDIIDLKQERLKGNYNLLTDGLVNKIKEKIDKKEKVFIFHNRKGLSHFIYCSDCGYVFKCPECQISFSYHLADKSFNCYHCGSKQEVPPLCPQCQGPNIKFGGSGMEKVGLELKKEFPNLNILTLSKSLNTETLKTSFGRLRTGNITIKEFNNNIVIGTEFVLNKINFNQFGLVAFINFDQLINRPEFRAQEKAYQLLSQIKSETAKADFIIQTYQPQNLILKSIQENKPEIFYQSELNLRKDLAYPPFVKIIKLIYQDKNEKKVIYKTKKVVRDLQKRLTHHLNGELTSMGPFENYPKKVRGKFRYNIIIKTAVNFQLSKIIKIIPNDFIIDVEPERLL